MKERTKRQIEMDYTGAMNGVESALLVLKNCWMGDAGGSTELAGEKTVADIYRTADDLIKVANNIRRTADIVYHAEIEAIGLCS